MKTTNNVPESLSPAGQAVKDGVLKLLFDATERLTDEAVEISGFTDLYAAAVEVLERKAEELGLKLLDGEHPADLYKRVLEKEKMPLGVASPEAEVTELTSTVREKLEEHMQPDCHYDDRGNLLSYWDGGQGVWVSVHDNSPKGVL